MNLGTKLRTILTFATCLNTALMATDLTGFSNATVDFVYRIVSIVLNFVIIALSTYFNNDYTEEACIATGHLRLAKQQAKGNIPAENFVEEGEDDV